MLTNPNAMYSVRLWASRHARLFESIYKLFEPMIFKLHPFWKRIGYQRLEKPVSLVEGWSKGLLFDCRMCGQCMLSSSGMSCPMNCPKNMRNGPCGGVRPNGNCEIHPELRCVWVEAWEGSKKMRQGQAILDVQKPLNHSQKGTSSWLRVVRQFMQQRQSQQGE